MGNGLLWWLCVSPAGRRRGRSRRAARLVLWGGETRAADPGRTAGEVMVKHGAGGRVVCRADGFRLGRPAPVLAIEDRLEAGRTYLVLPVDRLPAQGQGRGAAVTAASLAALSYDKGGGGVSSSSARSPFEYVKDGDGRTVISVTQEFIVKTVTARRPPGGGGGGGGGGDEEVNIDGRGTLCSTPELRKHYEQLVGAARGRRPWSPRLETIKERKGRRVVDVVSPRMLSPVRLLGSDRGVS